MRQSQFILASQRKRISKFSLMVLGAFMTCNAGTALSDENAIPALISIDGNSLQTSSYVHDAVVTVSHPGGSVSEHSIRGGESLGLHNLASNKKHAKSRWGAGGSSLEDGVYKYELTSLPDYLHTRTAEEFESNQYENVSAVTDTVSGSFRVLNGQVVSDQLVEPEAFE